MEGSISLLKEFILCNFGRMDVEEIKDRKIVRIVYSAEPSDKQYFNDTILDKVRDLFGESYAVSISKEKIG